MKGLTDIKYSGDLTFEIQNFVRHVPDALRDTLLIHTVEIGRYLMSRA